MLLRCLMWFYTCPCESLFIFDVVDANARVLAVQVPSPANIILFVNIQSETVCYNGYKESIS